MTQLPVLDTVEQRVIGCLLEKQVTVPATYPLTLNALRTACNQSSSRDPVMDLDERTVETTARTLRDRGLVRVVWSDTGRRVLKYHQTLVETLNLAPDERALVTVLLLRGPQAPGELRTRSERLHPFASREEVEACLHRLGHRDEPLAHRLERRPGQQDHRWTHLLGPLPTVATDPAVVAVDRERPLADGAAARDDRVRAAYAAVVAEHPDPVGPTPLDLPFDRWLLDYLAAGAGTAPVMDAGCGLGQITAHLVAAGVDARGIDLTPELVAAARERFSGVRFDVGDLTRLIRPDNAGGWGAVLAWFSLAHLAGSELPAAVAALARPLAPGGVLAMAGFAGCGVEATTPWGGGEIPLDCVLQEPAEVVASVTAAGLDQVEWYLRGPVPGSGEIRDRWYVLARRPLR